MKKKSFEEKQLSVTMTRIEKIVKDISAELDIIFEELERKGRWNDFMINIDKAKPKDGTIDEVVPENYYEALHFAFQMTDKYEDLISEIERYEIEDFLLTGKGIEKVELPAGDLEILDQLGIKIEPGKSNTYTICNDNYEEQICLLYLKGRRALELTAKAFRTLKASKVFIFQNYR